MDAVSKVSVAQSVEALNEIMVKASEQSIALSKKMVAMSVEMALASEPGKGMAIDTVA